MGIETQLSLGLSFLICELRIVMLICTTGVVWRLRSYTWSINGNYHSHECFRNAGISAFLQTRALKFLVILSTKWWWVVLPVLISEKKKRETNSLEMACLYLRYHVWVFYHFLPPPPRVFARTYRVLVIRLWFICRVISVVIVLCLMFPLHWTWSGWNPLFSISEAVAWLSTTWIENVSANIELMLLDWGKQMKVEGETATLWLVICYYAEQAMN